MVGEEDTTIEAEATEARTEVVEEEVDVHSTVRIFKQGTDLGGSP